MEFTDVLLQRRGRGRRSHDLQCPGKSLLRHISTLQVNKRKEKKGKEGEKRHFLLQQWPPAPQ